MDIEKLAESLLNTYGITSLRLKRINGYANANYMLTTSDGKYILKTYDYDEYTKDVMLAETSLLNHLNQALQNDNTSNIKMDIPAPVAAFRNDYLGTLQVEHTELLVRILTFVEGTFLGDIEKPTLALCHFIGNSFGKATLALQGFYHMAYRGRTHSWDLDQWSNNTDLLRFIKEPSKYALATYFNQQLEVHYFPYQKDLRKGMIYGDANEWNILANDNTMTGLIDYGDACYTSIINEVAIAATYIAYDKVAWKAPLFALVKGYHSAFRLEEKEVELIFYAIICRLLISVSHAAQSRLIQPDNVYASSSEKNAWGLLQKLLEVHPQRFTKELKDHLEITKQSKQISTSKLLKLRSLHFSKNLSLSYDDPVHISQAAFQYMYDTEGNVILDAYNNIPHVGHAHPYITEVANRQMKYLNTNTRYLYDSMYSYSEKLLAKFEPSLNKVYFVNSGSAATDLVMRMLHEIRPEGIMVVMENGYHGNTDSGIDISHYKYSNPKGRGRARHIVEAPMPDLYRYPHLTGRDYALKLIEQLDKIEGPIMGFIAEPIIGCGGQMPLPEDYLAMIYPYIRRRGGYCISDEVQTGFGRVGKTFWGYQLHNVVPDMVILGKPMGNGHPIGGVIVSEQIVNQFEKGVEFFSSFGGNPVSCVIGEAVLDIIEKEQLQANASNVGTYYKEALTHFAKNHDTIGQVRGEGLFIGVEIVHDQSTQPNQKLASYIKNQMRLNHVLLSTDGPKDSVIKTKPPLCFTKSNVDEVIEKWESIMSSL